MRLETLRNKRPFSIAIVERHVAGAPSRNELCVENQSRRAIAPALFASDGRPANGHVVTCRCVGFIGVLFALTGI